MSLYMYIRPSPVVSHRTCQVPKWIAIHPLFYDAAAKLIAAAKLDTLAPMKRAMVHTAILKQARRITRRQLLHGIARTPVAK